MLIHISTKKHENAFKRDKEINVAPKIVNFVKLSINNERKIAKLKLAAFIVEHCSLNSIDHLGNLVKNLDPKSELLQDIFASYKIHISHV